MRIENCPGCGNGEYLIKGHPARNVRAVAAGVTYRQPDYVAKVCKQCGLYYKSHILDWAQLKRYYETLDAQKWDSPGLYPTEVEALRVLWALPPQSRILDYGCSTGRLLSRLAATHRCFGIEINSEAAAIAAGKGITILTEAELDVPVPMTFDAIVLSDVFEHLPRPTETLSGLYSHLAPGGILMITTGNADAPVCRNDIANFWYLRNVEHLAMMSRRYADYLAGRLGAKIIHWRPACHYDPTSAQRLRESIRFFAYYTLRNEPTGLGPALLAAASRFAERDWADPPTHAWSADHVVAVFKR
ncbi:MAG TPA: class I SAM-dependent methyltransferase [Tepidisphaeraceae bacterium]|nr:class I SAM-dependent methyltransferase [Tepidisphaeraceae bacterium]